MKKTISPATLFIFRVLLVIGGIILMVIVGKPMMESIQYRFSGTTVNGKVIGFRGSGTSTSIFDENTASKGKRRKSRRPVYRYPITDRSLDSLDGFAKSTVLIPWFNFENGEKVTVVFDSIKPEKSHLFSIGILFTDTLLILLCLYMVKLGVTRRE